MVALRLLRQRQRQLRKIARRRKRSQKLRHVYTRFRGLHVLRQPLTYAAQVRFRLPDPLLSRQREQEMSRRQDDAEAARNPEPGNQRGMRFGKQSQKNRHAYLRWSRYSTVKSNSTWPFSWILWRLN